MTTCSTLASAIDDVALGAAPSSALAAHLTTCAACTTLLERRCTLAQRIDRGLAAYVRAESPPGLPERIAARVVSTQRPHRSRWIWFGVRAGVALLAGFFIIAWLAGLRDAARTTSITELDAWRSPTAALLSSRSSILGVPFTLRRS